MFSLLPRCYDGYLHLFRTLGTILYFVLRRIAKQDQRSLICYDNNIRIRFLASFIELVRFIVDQRAV